MENWQIIAEDPLLWEVHLSAGLEGGNFDTLMKNYERRWKPKLWRAKRFDFCDGLRAALTTGDRERVAQMRQRQRNLELWGHEDGPMRHRGQQQQER